MNIELVLGMVLVIAGFVLAVVEFMIPGFGLPGITSILCFVGGTLLATDTLEAAVTMAVIILAVLAVLVTICLVFVNGKKRGPFVLHDSLSAEQASISNEDLSYLVGKTGVAVTDLRPAGIGAFDGVEFDVRTEGRYVTKDTPIRITRISGSTLCVLADKSSHREADEWLESHHNLKGRG